MSKFRFKSILCLGLGLFGQNSLSAEEKTVFVFAGDAGNGQNNAVFEKFAEQAGQLAKPDLLVGKSNGALMAVLLAMGASSEEVVAEARHVFNDIFATDNIEPALQKAVLRSFIGKYYPGCEDISLDQLKRKIVLVHSKDEWAKDPVVFSNIPGLGNAPKESLLKAFMATIAMPPHLPLGEALVALFKINQEESRVEYGSPSWQLFAFGDTEDEKLLGEARDLFNMRYERKFFCVDREMKRAIATLHGVDPDLSSDILSAIANTKQAFEYIDQLRAERLSVMLYGETSKWARPRVFARLLKIQSSLRFFRGCVLLAEN